MFGGLRPIDPGVTDNHGHARWPEIDEMLNRFPGPHPEWGGVVVGEARRIDMEPVANISFKGRDDSTWGEGGRAPLLIDPCDEDSGSTHSLIFAGSGSFKTMSAASTQFHWKGPLISFDPSTELGPMMRGVREAMGQKVVFVGYDKGCVGVDVLSCIKPDKPGAGDRILSLTASMCGEEKERGPNAIFDSAGRNLIAALMAHLMCDETVSPEDKTIANLVDGVCMPRDAMKIALKQIHETSQSPLARKLAGTLMDLPDDTFGGAYFSATQMIGYLMNPENSRVLSGGLKPDAILRGDLSVYIQIPMNTLIRAAGVGRMIVDSFVNSAIEANGDFASRILLQVDEAKLIENMVSCETVLRMGRKYGLTIQLIYTAADDMEEVWGEKKFRTWLNGVSWAGYAAVASEKTQKYLSEVAGTRGVLAYSEGENSGSSGTTIMSTSRSKGRNQNVHEISKLLIRPEELRDSRTDELFVVTRSGRMIRCGVPIYFRRREMVSKIQATKYHRRRQVA